MNDLGASPGDEGEPVFGAHFKSDLLALIRWRRDVRRFRTDPLPPGTIENLLEIAELAPSVGLSQPWRFVTVDHPDRRQSVLANFEACNADALADFSGDRMARYAQLKLAGLRDAPCHVALFCDEQVSQGHGLGRRTMPETLSYSAVMALHTIWLAARAEGLGLGWVSILDPAAVSQILDVPPAWKFIGYFCIGYPQSNSLTPELESSGWEQRSAAAQHRLRR